MALVRVREIEERKSVEEIAENCAMYDIDYNSIKETSANSVEENRRIFADLIFTKEDPFSADEITDELVGIVGESMIDPSSTTYDFLEDLSRLGFLKYEKGKYIPKTINEAIRELY